MTKDYYKYTKYMRCIDFKIFKIIFRIISQHTMQKDWLWNKMNSAVSKFFDSNVNFYTLKPHKFDYFLLNFINNTGKNKP